MNTWEKAVGQFAPSTMPPPDHPSPFTAVPNGSSVSNGPVDQNSLEAKIKGIENNLKKKVMETKGLAANLEFYDFKIDRFDLLNDDDIKRYEEFIKMSNQIGTKTSGVHVSSEDTYMCEESNWFKKTIHPITVIKYCKYKQKTTTT